MRAVGGFLVATPGVVVHSLVFAAQLVQAGAVSLRSMTRSAVAGSAPLIARSGRSIGKAAFVAVMVRLGGLAQWSRPFVSSLPGLAKVFDQFIARSRVSDTSSVGSLSDTSAGVRASDASIGSATVSDMATGKKKSSDV
jgi:hypothetical protein